MKDKKPIDPDFPDFDEVLSKNKKSNQAEERLGITEISREELEMQLNEAESKANAAEAKVDALEAKINDYKETLVRNQAEIENIRRRAEKDVIDAKKFGSKPLASQLLPVMDNLERSLEHKTGDIETLHTGVELTLKLLQGVMEKFGIKVINPVGEMFDPNLHEAMSMQESDKAPGTVLAVLQKGYLLHDRLLRPAMVVVAKS